MRTFHLYSPNPATDAKPYFEEGDQWTRFAYRLGRLRGAHAIKQDAFAFSLAHRTKGLAFPARLCTEDGHAAGWKGLAERIAEGERFPEVELRHAVVRETNPDTERRVYREVVRAVLHASHGRYPLGIVPHPDAVWIGALLREDLPLKAFVKDADFTGDRPALTVVVSRAAEAARAWNDIIDARTAARTERRESRRSTAVPAYVHAGDAAPYAGTDLHRQMLGIARKAAGIEAKIAGRERRIEEMRRQATRREQTGRPASKLREAIRRMTEANRRSLDILTHVRGEEVQAQQRTHRAHACRIDAPTVEDWIRESIEFQVPEGREIAFSHMESEDYWRMRSIL